MKTKTIALVGGCGFIGHNLTTKLKSLNHQVFVIDSLSVNNLYSLKEIGQNLLLYKSILNNRLEIQKK